MNGFRWLPAAVFLALLAGCAAGTPGPTPTIGMVSCSEAANDPTGGPPGALTPDYPCQPEIWTSDAQCVMADAATPYLCSRSQSVEEVTLAQDEQTVFYRRTYLRTDACRDAMSSQWVSLRLCDAHSGKVAIVVDDVLSDLKHSPDGAWIALIADEPNGQRLKPHLVKLTSGGASLTRLDVRPLPFSMRDVQLRGWSADGVWIEVSAPDGAVIRIKADGSGGWERG